MCLAYLQECIINCYKYLSHAHTHTHTTTTTTTMIGKEYVCVLRLHSAIESETRLAKVTLNALADHALQTVSLSFPVYLPP